MTAEELNTMKKHNAELKRINGLLPKAKSKDEINILLKELCAFFDKDAAWSKKIFERNFCELKARYERANCPL